MGEGAAARADLPVQRCVVLKGAVCACEQELDDSGLGVDVAKRICDERRLEVATRQITAAQVRLARVCASRLLHLRVWRRGLRHAHDLLELDRLL